jgi:hypothetical protein
MVLQAPAQSQENLFWDEGFEGAGAWPLSDWGSVSGGVQRAMTVLMASNASEALATTA